MIPKGYKMSEETKRKIGKANSIALRGKTLSEETKRKIGQKSKLRWEDPAYRKKVTEASRGRRHTEQTKRRMSEIAKEKGTGKWKRTKPRSPEYRLNISKSKIGEKHWNWKGGITKERVRVWHSEEYKQWRTMVFERDNYTCQECGIKSGNGKRVVLNADHIKPWSLYPELRYNINNGRTLCRECHIKTPTYGGKIHGIKQKF